MFSDPGHDASSATQVDTVQNHESGPDQFSLHDMEISIKLEPVTTTDSLDILVKGTIVIGDPHPFEVHLTIDNPLGKVSAPIQMVLSHLVMGWYPCRLPDAEAEQIHVQAHGQCQLSFQDCIRFPRLIWTVSIIRDRSALTERDMLPEDVD